MNAEIDRLGLPGGLWQDAIRAVIPGVQRVDCTYPDERTLVIDIKPYARFSLSFLPGCKGILVSHAMFVEPAYRGQGIGHKLQEIKARIARDLGASVLLCTAADLNEAERHLLSKSLWGQILSFFNRRTGHQIGIYVRRLNP